jgi:hypothetical protein
LDLVAICLVFFFSPSTFSIHKIFLLMELCKKEKEKETLTFYCHI